MFDKRNPHRSSYRNFCLIKFDRDSSIIFILNRFIVIHHLPIAIFATVLNNRQHYADFGGVENIPIWAIKETLRRMWNEEEQFEKKSARVSGDGATEEKM